MRTIVLILLLYIGSSQIFAETPPKVVVRALKLKFPSAVNITWVKEYDNLWEANFNLKNKKVSSSFTADGHWIRSEMEVSITEIREEVRSSIKQDYSGCEIITIYMREYVGGGTSYEVKVRCSYKENREIYDSNGLRIRI